MAAKAKKSEKEIKNNAQSIMDAYKEHLLLQGKRPNSVFELCHMMGISEDEFYSYYASFDSLDKSIWAGFIQSTLDILQTSDEYMAYPVREKLLSFYYTYIEVVKKNRSYILFAGEKGFDLLRKNVFDKSHSLFIEYTNQLIVEGYETAEVVKRPYLSDKYAEALWVQFLFVLNFWMKDDSAAFEKTDAAIEKAVKLSFDLIGPGAVDSMMDMAKFIFQNK
ncbi:MAG: TetR family transcriptional regulator C-terminal domain-containing protein [Bacteroidales bacterium]